MQTMQFRGRVAACHLAKQTRFGPTFSQRPSSLSRICQVSRTCFSTRLGMASDTSGDPSSGVLAERKSTSRLGCRSASWPPLRQAPPPPRLLGSPVCVTLRRYLGGSLELMNVPGTGVDASQSQQRYESSRARFILSEVSLPEAHCSISHRWHAVLCLIPLSGLPGVRLLLALL